jgi:hypothetical protein
MQIYLLVQYRALINVVCEDSILHVCTAPKGDTKFCFTILNYGVCKKHGHMIRELEEK